MVALTAIAMGARKATVRQLKVADLATTVLVRRLLAVLGILAGAVVGALMWKLTGVAMPLLLAGAIVLVVTWLLARARNDGRTGRLIAGPPIAAVAESRCDPYGGRDFARIELGFLGDRFQPADKRRSALPVHSVR